MNLLVKYENIELPEKTEGPPPIALDESTRRHRRRAATGEDDELEEAATHIAIEEKDIVSISRITIP